MMLSIRGGIYLKGILMTPMNLWMRRYVTISDSFKADCTESFKLLLWKRKLPKGDEGRDVTLKYGGCDVDDHRSYESQY